MSDRRLRSLSRKELVDIIYELQRKDAEQQKTIERLQKQLSGRLTILEHAGSIAEAVVGLNELFAVAQKTADDYIASVRVAVDTGQLEDDAT